MRLILAVAVLAQLFACQAILAPAASASAAAIQDMSHGTGHDVVCEAGAAPAASSTARTLGLDSLTPAEASAVLVALVAAALSVSGRAGSGGMPSWAPQRLITGRHRLLAVGITRV